MDDTNSSLFKLDLDIPDYDCDYLFNSVVYYQLCGYKLVEIRE